MYLPSNPDMHFVCREEGRFRTSLASKKHGGIPCLCSGGRELSGRVAAMQKASCSRLPLQTAPCTSNTFYVIISRTLPAALYHDALGHVTCSDELEYTEEEWFKCHWITTYEVF